MGGQSEHLVSTGYPVERSFEDDVSIVLPARGIVGRWWHPERSALEASMDERRKCLLEFRQQATEELAGDLTNRNDFDHDLSDTI